MKALIVTADDFGAALEVNEAVEQAHRSGILTAASLMVAGPAAADAVARACRMPGLRVGLHLTLLEGRPVLPPEELASLVDAQGLFRTDMERFGFEIFTRASVRRQVANEITAQFQAYTATGLPLDHVNAHKHFHLHPTLAGMILRIGARRGMKAIRVPYEPRAMMRQIEQDAPASFALDTLPWSFLLRRRATAAGMSVADRVFGLRWSGAMTRNRLSGLIRHLPGGVSEIYLHPATGPFEGAAPGYRYREELEALCDPAVVAEVKRGGIVTGGYSDFEMHGRGGKTGVHRIDFQEKVVT